MLRVEYPYNGNSRLVRHYSDANMMIRQTDTDTLYEEAVDIYPTAHTYAETNIPVETGEMELQDPSEAAETIGPS